MAYIEREALQEKLERKKSGPANKRYTEGWNDAIMMVKSMIHGAPAADVAPVRHGRWERTSDGAARCTACKRKMNPSQYGYAFCSLCGAKMDGGAE